MMDIEMGDIKEDKTLTLGSGDEKISILLLKEEIGLGLIGMINSKLFPMNVGLVALSGKPEDDQFCIAARSHSKDGKGQFVAMDEKLIEGLRSKTDEAIFALLHELGHLVNNDSVSAGEEFERYNHARMDKVQNGEVLDMELRADAFATKYLGTQAAANALRALMEREKAYYSSDDFDEGDLQIALDEIEYRIKHLERAT